MPPTDGIRTVFRALRDLLEVAVRGRRAADDFALAAVGMNSANTSTQPFSLKDLIGDGFLWGVPTHRRTIEKRLTRKFGHPKYVMKIFKPKTTLRVCNVCGDDHEVGRLCPTCYKKVIDETKVMQDAIQDKLGLEPVEKEVVVLYEGEKIDESSEFFQSKRIVEVKKSRPVWFSKNLLQESTQQPANTDDIKPSNLG